MPNYPVSVPIDSNVHAFSEPESHDSARDWGELGNIFGAYPVTFEINGEWDGSYRINSPRYPANGKYMWVDKTKVTIPEDNDPGPIPVDNPVVRVWLEHENGDMDEYVPKAQG